MQLIRVNPAYFTRAELQHVFRQEHPRVAKPSHLSNSVTGPVLTLIAAAVLPRLGSGLRIVGGGVRWWAVEASSVVIVLHP